jgi:hypothetical protein
MKNPSPEKYRDVRYWPLADIASCIAHVCYWPKADIGPSSFEAVTLQILTRHPVVKC